MTETIVLGQDTPFMYKTTQWWSFYLSLPSLHLKRWCLVGIGPILSEIETEKNGDLNLVPFCLQCKLHAHRI